MMFVSRVEHRILVHLEYIKILARSLAWASQLVETDSVLWIE